jgi:hypothetical protein
MLAQVLAADGNEVDLVGHEDVGKEVLADHLGLNLGKVALRVVPDRGEASVADLSSQYELFVNASYMSRVHARAARNLYLCYFPTPVDHDLVGWRRFLARRLGRYVPCGAGAAPPGRPGAGPAPGGRGPFPTPRGRAAAERAGPRGGLRKRHLRARWRRRPHPRVAVSRMRMADQRFEPRRWTAERFPWLLRDPTDLRFLDHYDRVLANSE